MFPDNPTACISLGQTYVEIGKYEDAIVESEKAVALAGGSLDNKAKLGYVYAKSGMRDEAKTIINELEEQINLKYVSPYQIASIYSALNEGDLAFQWLKEAFESRDLYINFLKVDPIFDNIRSDPRFEMMLKKINLN